MEYRNCTNPYLFAITENIIKCKYGYFLKKENGWIFTPSEQELDTSDLLSIMDAMRNLNESI